MGKTPTGPKPVPLPVAEGPRLHPFPAFQDGKSPEIEFIQHLGTGLTAHVFKARIDGHIYALKVFKFEKVGKYWVRVADEYYDKLDENLVEAHMHPFYCECRAYGRLKEVDKESLAARCYGYLFLTKDQERELDAKLGPFSWMEGETDEETDQETDASWSKSETDGESSAKRDPDWLLQVIVKEFIPGTEPFSGTKKDARRMVRDLKALHLSGIVLMDMKEDAYVGGVLVDFSHARTIPHLKFDPSLGFDAYREGQDAVWADLASLSDVFCDWDNEPENKDKPKINWQLTPDWRRREALRSNKTEHFTDQVHTYDYHCDPTKFDWRRAARQALEAQAGTKKRGPGRPPGKKPSGVRKRGRPTNESRAREEPKSEHKKTQRKRPR